MVAIPFRRNTKHSRGFDYVDAVQIDCGIDFARCRTDTFGEPVPVRYGDDAELAKELMVALGRGADDSRPS